MITCIWRAEVEVPEIVYRTFGHLPEWDHALLNACAGTAASGQDAYGKVYVWAEDSDRLRIESVNNQLNRMMTDFYLKATHGN